MISKVPSGSERRKEAGEARGSIDETRWAVVVVIVKAGECVVGAHCVLT